MSRARLGGGEWYLSLRAKGGSIVSIRLERGVGVRGTAISDMLYSDSEWHSSCDTGRAVDAVGDGFVCTQTCWSLVPSQAILETSSQVHRTEVCELQRLAWFLAARGVRMLVEEFMLNSKRYMEVVGN